MHRVGEQISLIIVYIHSCWDFHFIVYHAKKTLKCSAQGLKDVTDHIGKPSHKSNASAISTSRTIDFPSASSYIKESVIGAEVVHTNFLVQHNLSFLTADHLSPL